MAVAIGTHILHQSLLSETSHWPTKRRIAIDVAKILGFKHAIRRVNPVIFCEGVDIRPALARESIKAPKEFSSTA